MTLEELKQKYKGIIDSVTTEIHILTSSNIEPKLIICDAEGYSLLFNAVKFQFGFPPSIPENPKNLKVINIIGYNLRVIQRVEPEFKGIGVYGTPIKVE